MNILQIHKFFWKRDGASNYMFALSDLLHDQGHNVIPFSTKHPKNIDSPYSKYFVTYRDLSGKTKTSFKQKLENLDNFIYSHEAKKNLEKLLDNEVNIDVAHIHNIYHHITPSILPVLKKRNIKVVMTLHDYKLFSPNYSMFHHGQVQTQDHKYCYLNCLKHKCFKDSYVKSAIVTAEMIFHHKIMNYYGKYVDMFIAPSKFMKDMYIKMGWPKEKIIHVTNPALHIKKQNYKEGNYVTYAGALIYEKGLQHLLEAAQMLPDVPFMIIGTGANEKELKAYVKRHQVTNVRFTGFQTGNTLKSLIQDARLLVLPSIWNENYPLSILEAKIAQKVTIASDIGGLPELVPKELLTVPGSSQDLADKIGKWYNTDKTKREAMGKKLRAQVLDHNDPDKHVKKIISIYKSI